jgi:hypothetical protein
MSEKRKSRFLAGENRRFGMTIKIGFLGRQHIRLEMTT